MPGFHHTRTNLCITDQLCPWITKSVYVYYKLKLLWFYLTDWLLESLLRIKSSVESCKYPTIGWPTNNQIFLAYNKALTSNHSVSWNNRNTSAIWHRHSIFYRKCNLFIHSEEFSLQKYIKILWLCGAEQSVNRTTNYVKASFTRKRLYVLKMMKYFVQ